MTTKSLNSLIEELKKLPSIGDKSALRLALHILKQPPAFADQLAGAIINARQQLKYCTACFNFAENDLCSICQQPDRDNSIICVVPETKDVTSIEESNGFNGLYHVLQGLLSPMEGVGENDIRLKELINRVATGNIKEILLALPSSIEAEATSLRIKQFVGTGSIKLTRLAFGLAVGVSLEFCDPMSLEQAIINKKPY